MTRLVLVVCCLSFLAGAETLPRTEAETLAGGKVMVPDVFSGRTVLVVSFSKGAGERSGEWMKALAGAGIPAYSLAMLEAAPRLIRPMIRRGMRGDMPAAMQQRGLCLYSGEKQWRAALGVARDEAPVVAVVEKGGEVTWKQQGFFTPEGLKAVQEKL